MPRVDSSPTLYQHKERENSGKPFAPPTQHLSSDSTAELEERQPIQKYGSQPLPLVEYFRLINLLDIY